MVEQLRYVTSQDPLFPQAAALRYQVLHRPLGLPEDGYEDGDAFSRHLVALCDDTVVGYARLVLSGRTARIRHVAVHPDFRRHGVGAHIVEELVMRARAEGAGMVWVNARFTAIGFWQNLGFKQAGQLSQAEDTHLPHQRMELRL